MFQNANLTSSFNLYSSTAARTISSQSKRKSKPAKHKQTIQLHFINPNLLFVDHDKYSSVPLIAGKQHTKDIKQKLNCNYQAHLAHPQLKKKQFSKQNCEGWNFNRRKSMQQKLTSYIKMQKVFLNFRKTGNFRMGNKQANR